jgi:hypothetical protein
VVIDYQLTKMNFFHLGCLNNELLLCYRGCEVIEDLNHLFLNCDFSNSTWRGIISWLGVQRILPNNVISFASQFNGDNTFHKDKWVCFQVIWLTTAWLIWKTKIIGSLNKIVF